MSLTQQDKEVLRTLAKRYADYASLPVQKEKKEIFMEISLAHLWKEEQKEKPGWNRYRIFTS